MPICYVKRLLIILFLFCSTALFSQEVAKEERLWREARSFFSNGSYAACLSTLQKLSTEEPTAVRAKEELIVRCLINLRSPQSWKQIMEFATTYPLNAHVPEFFLYLGLEASEQQDYEQALEAFDKINPHRLPKEHFDSYFFHRGIALEKTQRLEEAGDAFYRLTFKDSFPHRDDACIRYGIIEYNHKHYMAALKAFERVKDNDKYASIIPYYKIRILFYKESYQQLLDYALPLLPKLPLEELPAIHRLVGLSFYQVRNYSEALHYLKRYLSTDPKLSDEEKYIIGYCYYAQGNFQSALEYLEGLEIEDDLLRQKALMTLAISYTKTDKLDKARIVFMLAAQESSDKNLQEEAHFSYARLNYELDFSPFEASLRSFQDFLSKYPSSKHWTEVRLNLIRLLQSTHNYARALEYIRTLNYTSEETIRALQRASYFHALEQINQAKYDSALTLLDISLNNSLYDASLKAIAMYWKAEVLYLLGNYDAALSYYLIFENMPESKKYSHELMQAHYGISYSFFQKKNYKEAQRRFEKVLKSLPDKSTPLASDVYNRLGDCAFVNRRFLDAVFYYKFSRDNANYNPDYAIYRMGYIRGFLRKYKLKLYDMKLLLRNYPNSAWADKSLYQLGRTNEILERPDTALSYYLRFEEEFPLSPLYPQVLLNTALIYFNKREHKLSIGYYERVIEDFPNTQAARDGLIGLKNNYVELGDIAEFVLYARRIGGEHMLSRGEEDSLMFVVAEKNFFDSTLQREYYLQNYLDSFPNGFFIPHVIYYLAQVKLQEGDSVETQQLLEQVAEMPTVEATTPALELLAPLAFARKEYEIAFFSYQKLYNLADDGDKQNYAAYGMVNSSWEQGEHDTCIAVASKLLQKDEIPETWQIVVRSKYAKSLIAVGRNQEAAKTLAPLTSKLLWKEGAEACFLLSGYYFNIGELKKAEELILLFIQSKSPYHEWLGKCFILLARIYEKQGKVLEAKYALQSLIDNYPDKQSPLIKRAYQIYYSLESQITPIPLNEEKEDSVPTTTPIPVDTLPPFPVDSKATKSTTPPKNDSLPPLEKEEKGIELEEWGRGQEKKKVPTTNEKSDRNEE